MKFPLNHQNPLILIETKLTKKQRRIATRPLLKCKICGRMCHSKFYNVQSCESCKQFFRRIILKMLKYECKKDSNCNLPATRVICRGCRLNKCLTAGMDPSHLVVELNADQKEYIKWMEMRRKMLLGVGKLEKSEKFIDEENLAFSNENFCLLELLELESRVDRIYHSTTEFPESVVEFDSLEDMLLDNNYVLAHSNEYQLDPANCCDMDTVAKNIAENGLRLVDKCGTFFVSRCYFLPVCLAKCLPGFRRLELRDQIALISSATLVAKNLMTRFYSLRVNSATIIGPRGVIPYCVLEAATRRYDNDKNILPYARKMCITSLQPFAIVKPCREDFILLMAMAFSNPAIPGLTPNGHQILQQEQEKYAKLLLEQQQCRFGAQQGAVRYMELLQLLTLCIELAERNRQFMVYREVVLEQNSQWKPKALIQAFARISN